MKRKLPGFEPPEREGDRWWKIRIPLGPLTVAYILIVGAFFFSSNGLHEQQDRFKRQVAQDDYESCIQARDSRRVLRDVLVLTDDSGPGPRFTEVPGFEDLDAELKIYLANLEVALAPPQEPSVSEGGERRSQFVERALKLIEVPECPEP